MLSYLIICASAQLYFFLTHSIRNISTYIYQPNTFVLLLFFFISIVFHITSLKTPNNLFLITDILSSSLLIRYFGLKYYDINFDHLTIENYKLSRENINLRNKITKLNINLKDVEQELEEAEKELEELDQNYEPEEESDESEESDSSEESDDETMLEELNNISKTLNKSVDLLNKKFTKKEKLYKMSIIEIINKYSTNFNSRYDLINLKKEINNL